MRCSFGPATTCCCIDAGPVSPRDPATRQRVLLPLMRALGQTRASTCWSSAIATPTTSAAPPRCSMRSPVGQVHSSLDAEHPLLAARAIERGAARPVSAGAGTASISRSSGRPPPSTAAHMPPNALSCVVEGPGPGAPACCSPATSRPSRRPRSSPCTAMHCAASCCSSCTTAAGARPALRCSTRCSRVWRWSRPGTETGYGHPAADVLERYRERGIALRLSPDCGAWMLTLVRTAHQTRAARDAARRYWRGAGPSADGRTRRARAWNLLTCSQGSEKKGRSMRPSRRDAHGRRDGARTLRGRPVAPASRATRCGRGARRRK